MFKIRKKDKKINVYFLCQYKQGYNKFIDVVKGMQNDTKFNVKVLAIPENIKNFPTNEDYNFWYSKFGSITINAIINNKWYDLKKEKPDCVFIQRPYENYLPQEYHITSLKQYSKICYIPYAFELINLRNIAMPDFFVKSIDMFFCTQSEEYKYCNNIIKNLNDGKKNEVYDLGYPSLYNIVKKVKEYNSAFSRIDKKINFNVIWTPRWTIDDKLCKTSFFDYKDKIIEYIKSHKDINFIFRPHPLAFENFINEKLMTKKQVDDYLNNFNNSNMYYDNSSEYYYTFAESDVLITDFSSIIIEYFLFNKPIIYCYSKNENETDFMKKMKKCFYCVSNWNELKTMLENLKAGNDPLSKKREKLLKEILKKYEDNVSLKIINKIKEKFLK